MRAKGESLILAFYPCARGVAYVIFEGPYDPVDWGMSDLSSSEKNEACLKRLGSLLDQYRPDAVLLRDSTAERAVALLRSMLALAEEKGTLAVTISRPQVREAFSYLRSPGRYAIAKEIAKGNPTLAALQPSARKIWNGEDRRMSLFDAVALALTYFRRQTILFDVEKNPSACSGVSWNGGGATKR